MQTYPILLCVVLAAQAQTPTPRIEAGVQLSSVGAHSLGEKPPAGGGRLTVAIYRFIDAEFEVNRFPIGGAVSLFPGTQVLMGGRAGYRIGPIGLFAKVRPGCIRFDSNPYAPRLGTRPALDFGGIVEFYARRHFAVRFDYGDAVVFYGREPMLLPSGGQGLQPGTRHQLQGGIGISFWF